MTTVNTISNAAAQTLIDQRLDVIDGALVGVLRRTDRLAIVTQIETLIREQTSPAIPQSLIPAFGGVNGLTGKKRSRLALSAGVLGIAALVLLFGVPVTYAIVGFAGELLGETFALSVLGAHLMAVTLGGVAAVGLGIAALVSLKRRKESLTGHGWAITGLCTGPLAMFVGGMAAIFGGLQVLESQYITVQSVAAGDPMTSGMMPPSAYNADAITSSSSPAELRFENLSASEGQSPIEPQWLPQVQPAAEPPSPEAVPLPEPQSTSR